MSRRIIYQPRYIRDVRRIVKKHYDISLLFEAEAAIMSGERNLLNLRYGAHVLKGEYRGLHELHIQPDWLSSINKTVINHICFVLERMTIYSKN